MALTVVDIVCPGDSSGSFQVSAADGVAPYSITLGNDTIGIDVAFTGLLAGVYPFTLTDAAGCSLNGSATIAEPAPIVLSVSPENAVIEIGDPQPMLVTSNYDIDLVLWSPDIGLSCAGCVDPTYTGDSTEQFHVEALVDVNDALCPAMTDATVQVRARLFAPNAFTPNGDGINDVFAAVGLNLESFEAFEIRITDRWGRQLFLSKSPLFNWTGGDEPNGVYAWNIEYRQPGLTGIKRAQGHVALIR